METYTASSDEGDKISYDFSYSQPKLLVQLTVVGGPTSQSTSFNLDYEFKKDDNTYDVPSVKTPNLVGILVGTFVGVFGFVAIVSISVSCYCRRVCPFSLLLITA